MARRADSHWGFIPGHSDTDRENTACIPAQECLVALPTQVTDYCRKECDRDAASLCPLIDDEYPAR